MIKVGVLMGGMSIEREVSFNSGRTICDHLDTKLFQVIPLFQTEQGVLYILPWTFLYRGKIADFHARLATQAQQVTWDELPLLIDFMYIAVHGRFAEDGTLQAMLELLKIPYLGSKVLPSALGMHKHMHNQYLQACHIDVPKGFCLTVQQIQSFDNMVIDELLGVHNMQFPVIVKPVQEGSSFGVFVVKDREHLQAAIEKSSSINGKAQAVLVEEKIVGMEFTCIVITDYHTGHLIALPPTEVLIAKHTDIFDYQQKYMPGAVHEKTPARCSEHDLKKIQDTSIAAMQTLGFTNLARIDGFLTPQGKVIIIDSNPLSGMGPATFLFRQAVEYNMSHTQLINHLIKTELQSYAMESYKESNGCSDQKKLNIAVLFGGPSNEREISLESGRNVVYKLSPENYAVFPIYMARNCQLYVLDHKLLVCHSTQEIEDNLTNDMKVLWSDLPNMVDFTFIALHGSPGEDGKVQGALEMLRMPYNGSGVLASSLCMNKFKTTQFLRQQGFDVPQGFLLSYEQWIQQDQDYQKFLQTLVYPCIVKPHDDGCSVMVASPKNAQELDEALNNIFAAKKFALIEERIHGMELTVGVIGNDNPYALMPSQTVVRGQLLSLEEKFLPGAGENQTPALLPADDIIFVRQEIEKVYQSVNCKGYARIDCFFQNADQSPTGKRRLVIIEINTLPALTPATCIFHQAAEDGMRPMQFIDKIIQLGLEEHAAEISVSVDKALDVQNSWDK